jgi:tRNA-splicing ligase RtcB
MNAAANFAFSNRQMITYLVRKIWQKVYGSSGGELSLVYDVAHNMAKLENNLLVHRKGAIRAFPAKHPETPKAYRHTGHPVFIPGSMGTASYVLVGTSKALDDTFGTVCHGAGRRLSRSRAKKQIWGEDLKTTLESQGISIHSESMSGLAEEAPQAYKDIHEIIRVIEGAGLAKAVVQLQPVGVVKGS